MPKAWSRPLRAEGHELHAARAHRRDARQVDLAAARERERDQRCGAQLLRHRGIEADAFAGGEPVSVRDDARDGERGARARERRHGAASLRVDLAQGLASWSRRRRGKALPVSAGASHCSRTRATRWDRPRHLRLSATRRTCTVLSASVGPGRLHYGREVTRPTVEHHRQRRSHSTISGASATSEYAVNARVVKFGTGLKDRVGACAEARLDALAHVLHAAADRALQFRDPACEDAAVRWPC